jgi:hypothetical protein
MRNAPHLREFSPHAIAANHGVTRKMADLSFAATGPGRYTYRRDGVAGSGHLCRYPKPNAGLSLPVPVGVVVYLTVVSGAWQTLT